MRTLLDCGAFTGDTVATLVKRYGPFGRIVCFEANSNLAIDVEGLSVEVIRAAVWSSNGEVRFFFGEYDYQSSVMANKTSGHLTVGNSATVPSIDLAEWIECKTGPDDRVVVKLDIEGAEFPVLERLLERPACLAKIDHVFVEWHDDRLTPRWRYGLQRRLLEIRYRWHGRPLTPWARV